MMQNLPMWYVRRDSITKRFKCWEEFYEHSGNKDNIIFPLLIKLGLTHQVVDIVKVLEYCQVQLALNHQDGWMGLCQM